MKVIATLGRESHTTSSGWSKLSVDGKPVSFREATSKEWLTKYGDKHASWCECVFEVEDGARISWEAGANSGSRGGDRTRINLELVADSSAEIFESPDPGYPAKGAVIRGRLRMLSDKNADRAVAHARLVEVL